MAVRAEAPMSGELVVFTAASLTDAFTEIGQRFEAKYPGVKVVFNFAGSQQLAQQLGQGARADVFASANTTQMKVAIQAGRVASSGQVFAHNRLIVVYPADNPASIQGLGDLTKPGLSLVLAAEAVPVGQYSRTVLDRISQDPAFDPSFKERVLANVVSYEENVRAVFSKVVLGEADAGIVYASDVATARAARIGHIEIPDTLNTMADYPIAVVSDSAKPNLAERFIDFVLSAGGQATLAGYGFSPVKDSITE